MLGRRVLEDELVEGYLLPKGALVFVSPWAIHRMPEFWSNPLAFDPDRWAVEDARRAHGSYLPFSMGQRSRRGTDDGLPLPRSPRTIVSTGSP